MDFEGVKQGVGRVGRVLGEGRGGKTHRQTDRKLMVCVVALACLRAGWHRRRRLDELIAFELHTRVEENNFVTQVSFCSKG